MLLLRWTACSSVQRLQVFCLLLAEIYLECRVYDALAKFCIQSTKYTVTQIEHDVSTDNTVHANNVANRYCATLPQHTGQNN